MNAQSLNQRLAGRVFDFSWKQIPPHVVEDIKLRHRIAHMRGTRGNPMGREDFVAKFTRNAGDVVSARLLERTVAGILDLETSANVAPLLRALARRSPRPKRRITPP